MTIEGVLFQRLLNEIDGKINFLTQRSTETMATIQDLQDKIAAEKAQVAGAVDGLRADIQLLRDQLAGGVVVSSEQLDALMVAVDGIFDAAPAVVDEVPVELPSDVEQPVA